MEDQSMIQQDAAAGTQDARQPPESMDATSAGSGAEPKGEAGAAPDPEALLARIDELQRQNGKLTDRLADFEERVRTDEAAQAEHEAALRAADEAETARKAVAELQTRRNAMAEAWFAYRMLGLVAIEAAVSVRCGVYNPDRLATAIGNINDWSDRATGAVLSLGDAAHKPGSLPPDDVLDADIAGLRDEARKQLLSLATCAASYADLLQIAPHNTPALLAIGRTLDESFFGASLTLNGLGTTMTARGFA